MEMQDLFTAPFTSRSKLTPRTWPGITSQSTANLERIIKDNHEKWHVFFLGDYRAHNHSIHYVLALWALGADNDIIQAAYDHDCTYLVPKFNSPEKITVANFNEHLGDDKYYSAYLDFFKEVVKKQSVVDAVEQYVISEKANFISGKKEEEQPEMLNRFMEGIMHSMIQVGHGLEFNIPGLVAEGLAWTSVHHKSSSAVIPNSFWTASNQAPVASLTSRIPSLGRKAVAMPKGNVHALTILARILKDSRFDAIPFAEHYTIVYSNITSQYADAIKEYVQMWTFNQDDPQEGERKLEELVYANTLIYAVAGWSKDNDFNADFFHLHFVTSALLLYQFIEVLKPASQEVLLRSYFAVCLTWWIGRGRPGFDIQGFFAGVSTNPGPVTPFPAPHKDALPKADSPKASSPNPWFQLVQEALVIPDEHLPKAMRALAHYAELYGTRNAGLEDFRITELPGAELIDGTLFIRAALVTTERLRKEKDVEVLPIATYWDRKGFYKTTPGSEVNQGIPE